MAIGLAGLVSGFQQGFGFADEMRTRKEERERRAKDDAFRDETRTRQKKEWSKEDEYEAEVRAETEKFFPQNKPSTTPAAALGAGAPVEQRAAAQAAAPQDGPAPLDAELQGAPGAAMPAQQASAAKVAAIGAGAPAQDQFSNANATFDYLLRRAQIDLKHGKMDGVGLLTLQKTVQGMKAENMDQAIALMHQGRDAEAIALFNSAGEHRGRVLGVQEGVFEAGGVKVPTRIVTIETGNGERRVINTAQTLNQRLKMDQLIAQAQGGEQVKLSREQFDESKRHHQAQEGISRQNAAAAAAERAERRADAKKNPILEQIRYEEEAQGYKYDDKARAARADELAGKNKSYAAERSALAKAADKIAENVSANGGTAAEAAQARRDYIAANDDLDVQGAVAEHLNGKTPGTPEYAQAYQKALQAKGVTPERLASWNFPSPNQAVANPVQEPARPGAAAQRAAAGTMSRPNPNELRTRFDKNYQPRAAAPAPYQLEQQREAQAEQAAQAKRRAQDIAVLQKRIAMLEKDQSSPRARAQIAADKKRLADLQG